ncbi:MAG: hypothetical protein Kapaf2KO_15880 [Candidatus Kapaibacteriales bacterium]
MFKLKYAFAIIAMLMCCSITAQNVFISQYIDTDSGTAPKAIEIVNNTGAAINFAVTELEVFRGANGSLRGPNPEATVDSGNLPDGEVMVLGTQDVVDYVNNNHPGVSTQVVNFQFNGDDALIVVLDGSDVDMFGTEGVDPGSAWSGNGVSTADQNIQILSNITTANPTGFSDPSTTFETVTTNNDLTGFGVSPIQQNPPQQMGSLLISQYVESGRYKGLEIANATGNAIDFSQNALDIYFGVNGNNRGANPNLTINTGSLKPNEVIVIGGSEIRTFLDMTGYTGPYESYNLSFNGDDAIILSYMGNDVDMFGTEGTDPERSWTGNGVETEDQNLEIMSSIIDGEPSGFTDPSTRFMNIGGGGNPNGLGESPYPNAPFNFTYPDWYEFYDFQNQTLSPWTEFSAAGSGDWELQSRDGDFYVEGSAFQENGASDDWLISPAFDTRLYENKELSFEYVMRFPDRVISDALTLWYSNDYQGGDPSQATWTEINAGIDNNRNSWDFIRVSPVDIDNVFGNNIRFAFRYKSSGTGQGDGDAPNVRIDDFLLTGDRATGTPDRLAIADVTPNPILQNVNFYVTVEAVDANGVPQNVTQDTDVTINVTRGNGNLTGQLTGTILAGDYEVELELNYDLTGRLDIDATSNNMNLMDAPSVRIQSLSGPSELVFNNVYDKGHVDAMHPEFQVQALNSDGTVNSNFSGLEVEVEFWLNGVYEFSEFETFFNGEATISNVMFMMDGDYELMAEASGVMSMNSKMISVFPAPVISLAIIPQYFLGRDGAQSAFEVNIPNWAHVIIENLHPNTEYTYFPSALREDYSGREADLQQPGVSFRGQSIVTDENTGDWYMTGSFGRFGEDGPCPEQRRYGVLRTDGMQGSKQVWLGIMMNSDSRFNSPIFSTNGDENEIWWAMTIGNEFGDPIRVMQADESSVVTKFSDDPGELVNTATGIYDIDSKFNSNEFVALYDQTENNIDITRPLSVAKVQDGGEISQNVTRRDDVTCEATEAFPHQSPEFYKNIDGYYNVLVSPGTVTSYVGGVMGAWGTFLPNDASLITIGNFYRDGQDSYGVEFGEQASGIWEGVDLNAGMRQPGGLDNPIEFETPYLQILPLAYLQGNALCNDL